MTNRRRLLWRKPFFASSDGFYRTLDRKYSLSTVPKLGGAAHGFSIGAYCGYEITGTVDVTLHYGSGSDAASVDHNFSLTCTTAAATAEPLKLLSGATEMKVDASSWHGMDEEN